jgi:hypothetical protein
MSTFIAWLTLRAPFNNTSTQLLNSSGYVVVPTDATVTFIDLTSTAVDSHAALYCKNCSLLCSLRVFSYSPIHSRATMTWISACCCMLTQSLLHIAFSTLVSPPTTTPRFLVALSLSHNRLLQSHVLPFF